MWGAGLSLEALEVSDGRGGSDLAVGSQARGWRSVLRANGSFTAPDKYLLSTCSGPGPADRGGARPPGGTGREGRQM